jgi:hypothetical protein
LFTSFFFSRISLFSSLRLSFNLLFFLPVSFSLPFFLSLSYFPYFSFFLLFPCSLSVCHTVLTMASMILWHKELAVTCNPRCQGRNWRIFPSMHGIREAILIT